MSVAGGLSNFQRCWIFKCLDLLPPKQLILKMPISCLRTTRVVFKLRIFESSCSDSNNECCKDQIDAFIRKKKIWYAFANEHEHFINESTGFFMQ